MPLQDRGVYIHIPFCKKICTYCAFCKFYYDKKWIDKYLHTLEKEIVDRYLDDEISSLYIGGGSPSSLSIEEVQRCLKLIDIFKLKKDAEITFECNLNDLTDELIDLLGHSKVNRVSIGIESFDEKNLAFMGRESQFNDAKEKINKLKNVGINNLNIDLIYALPTQTMKALKKDLRLFLKLDVNHISTYSLMIEKNTILFNKKVEPINEDDDAKMYSYIKKYLSRHGFEHYEISNFAKKKKYSKHNLLYWNNAEYYGFGCGAAGYIDGIRYENTKNLNKYLKGQYTESEEILSIDDKMKYELILGLRKTKGVSLKEFYQKYKVNLQNRFDIKTLIKNKDLIYKKGYIFVNPDKLYIENEILINLV